MAYDGKLLARARAGLERRREESQEELRRRTELAYARRPELRQIDALMRGHMAELVRLTLSRRPDLAQRLKALKEENLALQAKKTELLAELGHPADHLEPSYFCPLCQDTGVYRGGVCSCLEKLYNMELTKELGPLLKDGDESFERFDLSLYSAAPDPESGIVPRELMAIAYESCKTFAENFPEVNTSLLLQGGTGLGKTYLSACVARVVARKGLSVCYDSAASALDAFERQKFSRDSEEAESAALRVRRMLSCDLMILDDLGTEMLTSMSISALYTLINSRLVSGKRMIISTNCGDEELRRRYSPQICSRIAGEFLTLPFLGRDIRLIKKGV